MAQDQRPPDDDNKHGFSGAHYARYQIARAFTTSQIHADPATRERAEAKIVKWKSVLENCLSGDADYGSRTPLDGVPAWATLEVLTGGFASGRLLAGGELQEYEQELLKDFTETPSGSARRTLNGYFLTDTGLDQLQQMLESGNYDIEVPEEAVLLVVAWLIKHEYGDEARELLETLSGFLGTLRFYPRPLATPRRSANTVHVQNVGRTIGQIRRIKPNEYIQAQKIAVDIWAPLHDRTIALFLETVQENEPCRNFPADWKTRALALLGEISAMGNIYPRRGKMHKRKGHAAQLRALLGKCALAPDSLEQGEIGRIRHILHCYLAKRGRPDSAECQAARAGQKADVSAPGFHSIAALVLARLGQYPAEEGLDSVEPLQADVSSMEAKEFNIPAGTTIPHPIRRKIERCLNEVVDELIDRGLIRSGEALAQVLPQLTSGIRAMGIVEPTLRRLYAAIYRAFRRRRSLLLLDLSKQVQIEELPWIAAIERFRHDNLSTQQVAHDTLAEISSISLRSFPQAILPNKLLQEMRALAKSAAMKLPLTEELAADIFMGQFSDKFLDAARIAADMLDDSLYAQYYAIDYDEVRRIPKPKPLNKGSQKFLGFWTPSRVTADPLAEFCAKRAGATLGTWRPAVNGMIIEQQQLICTHNLAVLFREFKLHELPEEELAKMAHTCFAWICRRLQMKSATKHAHLITLKQTAYAWRQMLFFLSFVPDYSISAVLRWANEYFSAQTQELQQRFRPALLGLELVVKGHSLDDKIAQELGARRFLGWTTTGHWLKLRN